MLILLIIYFRINFDIVVVNYTDDGFLELGSETSGLVLYRGNVLIGKVNNGTMTPSRRLYSAIHYMESKLLNGFNILELLVKASISHSVLDHTDWYLLISYWQK